jgi:hypothetical protein
MLGKCANPVCPALFRKLGTGKLFAFESLARAKSANDLSGTHRIKPAQSPVFFWLCETCSVAFTLGLDAAGQLTLQSIIPGGARVTIFDGHPLDQAG